MAQYFTLEQAAQILQVSVDRVKEMVKKNEVRAFQDRGTLRFRSQDIEEKARQLGLGSDHELQLGETAPKPGEGSPSSARRRAKAAGDAAAAKSGKTPAPRTGTGKKASKLDPPKVSSDSDIRLVGESGEQTFDIDQSDEPASRGGRGSEPSRRRTAVRSSFPSKATATSNSRRTRLPARPRTSRRAANRPPTAISAWSRWLRGGRRARIMSRRKSTSTPSKRPPGNHHRRPGRNRVLRESDRPCRPRRPLNCRNRIWNWSPCRRRARPRPVPRTRELTAAAISTWQRRRATRRRCWRTMRSVSAS